MNDALAPMRHRSFRMLWDAGETFAAAPATRSASARRRMSRHSKATNDGSRPSRRRVAAPSALRAHQMKPEIGK